MLARMGTLTNQEIATRLRDIEGWTLDGNAIRRQFVFPGFPDAILFVTRLAFDAEAADHHPDILVNYKRVTLTYSTPARAGSRQRISTGLAWPRLWRRG